MEREKFGSRLGFILISAGCAIGIGNVWRFPYVAGNNGGGIFVLFYLFFLVILGIPVLTMEFSVGRASGRSAVKACQQLEKPGQKWHLHGIIAVAGNYLLMMFYTVVTGWMLHYFYLMASGRFEGTDTAGVSAVYHEMLGSSEVLSFWMVIVVVVGFLICSWGLNKGLERISKWMMLALLAIIVVLAVRSLTLPGASEGLSFYLVPNLDNVKEIGIGNVAVAAMNQSFFTLSLGIGAMAIFGSYLDKKRSLMGEAVTVSILDTFVAVTSGLIIFPACLTYGINPGSGPGLIFETLPNVFRSMPAGRLWGSLFFVFLAFAAFSTILAVFENILSFWGDLFGWSRKKAALVNIFLMIALSMPCVLGFNVLSGLEPLKTGNTIMDLEDFLVSNLLLPLGSLFYVIFCTSRYGWGWKKFRAEANLGTGLKVPDGLRRYCTYVLPCIVAVIFIYGLVTYF